MNETCTACGTAFAVGPRTPSMECARLASTRPVTRSLRWRSIQGDRSVSSQTKLVQPYLNEFQFGFNKRWHKADLFPPLLQAAIDAGPFPYRHLTAEQTG